METITKIYNVYKFNELSEQAQEKALENLCDINVDYGWWESTYEDAAQAGIEITEFVTGRGNVIKGKITTSAPQCAEYIVENHGSDCDTHILAKKYLHDMEEIGESPEDYGDKRDKWEDDRESLDNEFERAVLEEYLTILKKEVEYNTTREAIIETIEANDYNFLENGEME